MALSGVQSGMQEWGAVGTTCPLPNLGDVGLGAPPTQLCRAVTFVN